MSYDLISTTDLFCTTIDCRNLSVAFEFYELSAKQMEQLCQRFMLWNQEIVAEGFVSEKRISWNQLCTSAQNAIHSKKPWSYAEDFYIIGQAVYNSKTIKEYRRNLLIASALGQWKRNSPSVDYPDFWNALFPNGRPAPEEMHQKIYSIFLEENRKNLGHRGAEGDVGSWLSFSPYSSNEQLFCGKGILHFSACSLGPCLQDMANHFASFLSELSDICRNLNGRVMLGGDGYRLYFGNRAQTDGSAEEHGYTEREWYFAYYLPSVEWFNVISPLAQSHFMDSGVILRDTEKVQIQPLHNGGLIVKSRKEITQYDVRDALALKEALLPALYPGNSAYPIRMWFPSPDTPYFSYHLNPRKNWEIVPVFPDEIKIVGPEVFFCHRSPDVME